MALLTRASRGSSNWRPVAALDERPLSCFQRFLRAISQLYGRAKVRGCEASMLLRYLGCRGLEIKKGTRDLAIE